MGKMVVRNKLKPLRSKIKRLRFIDVPAIYQGLFDQPDRLASWVPDGQIPDDWNHICRQTTERLDRGELPYEDAAPYIYLKEHLYGFPSYSSVRHVIVDEGQDYSPLQYAFLKRLFPRSKMTVLGDFNQAIHAHSETLDFDTLNGLFGKDDTKRIRLTRSYRSTRQIVEFTSGLVPESEIVPFHREGPKPTVTIIPEGADAGLLVAKRVEKLVADGHGTIAVICKTEKECAEAYDALKTDTGPLSRIHRITGETRHFEKGVVVIPFYLAKGVEFDAVIVYDASVQAYGGENDRKRLYTACTRAMHELHLFASGRLSPLISALDPETYTIE